MIKGIGIDIIEINRIARAVHKNTRFVRRILTEKEHVRYDKLPNERRKLEFLAGRFAAKEAFAKAMGTGIGKLSFQHIEILSDEHGAPKLVCTTYEGNIFISISHSKEYAVAQVVLT